MKKIILLCSLAIVFGCKKKEVEPDETDQPEEVQAQGCGNNTNLTLSFLEGTWELTDAWRIEWESGSTTQYTKTTIEEELTCEAMEVYIFDNGVTWSEVTPDNCGKGGSSYTWNYSISDCTFNKTLSSSHYYYSYYTDDMIDKHITLGSERFLHYVCNDSTAEEGHQDFYWGVRYVDEDEIEIVLGGTQIDRFKKI